MAEGVPKIDEDGKNSLEKFVPLKELNELNDVRPSQEETRAENRAKLSELMNQFDGAEQETEHPAEQTPKLKEYLNNRNEAPVSPPEYAVHEVVTNHFGLAVPMNSPHLYADATGRIFVYGGSPAEQTLYMQNYFAGNPNSIIIYSANNHGHCVPWHPMGGRLISGPPLRSPGFLGFFGKHLRPPGPDAFRRIIK